MSERLQTDFHPDADQISAFVEQALPEHERVQMLDHLAVCAECRAIVGQSLPELEEAPRPLPEPVRKPWWSGWVLAWPVAGAVAAGTFLFIYMHRAQTVPNMQQQQQVAVARAPELPARVEKPARETPRQKVNEHRAEESKAQDSGPAGVIANKATPGLNIPGEAARTLATTGRNFAAFRQPAIPSAPAAGNSSGAATGQGSGGTLGKVESGGAVGQLKNMAPEQPVGGPMNVAPQATGAASAPLASTSVAFSGAEPIQAETANLSNVEISTDQAQLTQIKRPLPSRRPVLSMAAQGLRIIAIDTHHAVFLSDDGGEHWKGIRAPWKGHAVKTGLAMLQARRGAEFYADKPLSLEAAPAAKPIAGITLNNALGPLPARASNLPGSSLSGTVTDRSGAAIAGASVVATEIATGTARTVVTDNAGHYVFDRLAAGNYRMEAMAPGFKKQQLAATVSGAAPTAEDLTLDTGAASQSVTVQAATVPEIATQTLPPASQEGPIFEITTEKGEHWTSPDGLAWTHRE